MNLVDFPCGCAVEKDGVWRGCTSHSIQANNRKQLWHDEPFVCIYCDNPVRVRKKELLEGNTK